jgi:acetyl esterase/lipase
MIVRRIRLVFLGLILCFVSGAIPSRAQQLAQPATPSWVASLMNKYNVIPNITYQTSNNYDDKLDVYVPRDDGQHPTLFYIHGGGWVSGSKEDRALSVFPFLEKGWTVVNVEYRMARVSLAPAAVEDCLCALRWVIQHAKEYKIDTTRIVAMGNSAGGHLALTTGMLPASAGLERQCPGSEDLKVAAILDWYGITDVNELLNGPNMRPYAVTWLGSQPDREQIAKRVSPLTYVRAGLPPIMIIQGNADPVVPYTQSVRLNKALDDAGVPHEFVTIPGGDHGQFSGPEMDMIYMHVWAFLGKYLPTSH